MIRVVLDTNIIVAALLQPLGPPAQLYVMGTGEAFQLCVSAKVCADPDDDAFLECAQAAQADYLVTGNLKHFPSSWGSTRVVTARWLLDYMLAEEPAKKS
jgi:predicted nucleic acid-binding protein